MWLAIMGALVGGFELINLINGWPINRKALYAVLVILPVGLTGTTVLWRREALDSYRAAIRKRDQVK